MAPSFESVYNALSMVLRTSQVLQVIWHAKWEIHRINLNLRDAGYLVSGPRTL